jgi:hypothetical protein
MNKLSSLLHFTSGAAREEKAVSGLGIKVFARKIDREIQQVYHNN